LLIFVSIQINNLHSDFEIRSKLKKFSSVQRITLLTSERIVNIETEKMNDLEILFFNPADQDLELSAKKTASQYREAACPTTYI